MHRGNLGCCHFVFFSHEVVKQLGLSGFEAVYSKAGRSAYSPELLLKVWLLERILLLVNLYIVKRKEFDRSVSGAKLLAIKEYLVRV